jgi:hypothetical protein
VLRSYTIDEVTRTLEVHRNTVRHWIKAGLPVIDDKRPILILGSDLAAPPARGAAPTASALPDAPPRPTGTKSGHMAGVSQAPGLILAAKSAAAPRTAMGVRTTLA